MLRRLVLLAILFFPGLAAAAPALTDRLDAEGLFHQANQAYKEGRIEEAIQGFQTLLAAGFAGGHVYYNLGNAYFKNGQLGQAILSYERARLRLPRDADLGFNLATAQDRTLDAVKLSRGVLVQTFFWLGSLTLTECFFIFGLANGIFWFILILRFFFKTDTVYYLLICGLALWLATGLSLALKAYQTGTDDRAVILGSEVSVRAGPEAKDTVLFQLHAGTVVYTERREGDWALIRLAEDKRGWVRADEVERIVRPLENFGFRPNSLSGFGSKSSKYR
jgi:tetratricopeptide (TPR) repeat protein